MGVEVKDLTLERAAIEHLSARLTGDPITVTVDASSVATLLEMVKEIEGLRLYKATGRMIAKAADRMREHEKVQDNIIRGLNSQLTEAKAEIALLTQEIDEAKANAYADNGELWVDECESARKERDVARLEVAGLKADAKVLADFVCTAPGRLPQAVADAVKRCDGEWSPSTPTLQSPKGE
jgi:hypothetical protein